MATVLHYVEHWLELSAGFVHAHVSRSRHRGVVVSHNAVENLDAFPMSPLWRLGHLHRFVSQRRWPSVRPAVLRAGTAAYPAPGGDGHLGFGAGGGGPVPRARRPPPPR